MKVSPVVITTAVTLVCFASPVCSQNIQQMTAIDLGALVTDTLPQQFWGKAFLKQMNFTRQK